MGLFRGDFYSDSLKMTTGVQVLFPEASNDVTPVITGTPRVLYLLHGLSGNCGEWTRFSKIDYYAKKYNFLIIMPEVQRSFYCDRPDGAKYFTYISEELPEICGTWLRLDQRRENTFIAGESMGGYGAVKAALRCPERFGAAAGLSGVLDYPGFLRMILNGEWPDFLPEEVYALHPDGVCGQEDDVIALVREQAKNPDRPRLIQLCGTEDFLYGANQSFRQTAEAAGYGHTYIEGPGDHEWPYWDKAVQLAFQFFCGLDMASTPIY